MDIIIVDQKAEVISALHRAFTDQDDFLFDMVEIKNMSIEDVEADAIVSPANSFGVMDGGVDIIISKLIGNKTVKKLEKEIVEKWHGELPVGSAITLKCEEDSKFKYLISAPTMRIPENVIHTVNAYTAFRAALLAAINEPEIETIVVPCFCTGWGGMTGVQAATQMKLAFDQIMKSPTIPSFDRIHKIHRAMRKTY